jgi:AcrR family transcriptional regulator
VPRDASATKERLVAAGRELFARPDGLLTSLKEIIDAAGQRNASALHYHFGGRDGLVAAIIEHHNVGIEATRAVMLDALGPKPTVDALVGAVVAPWAALLEDQEGRQFLSIVSQLIDLFDRWDDDRATPPQALRAFEAIERALPRGLSPALRHERVTRFLEMASEALGSRARQVDSRRPPTLPTETFVANLAAMAVGALNAPGPRS